MKKPCILGTLAVASHAAQAVDFKAGELSVTPGGSIFY